MAGFLAVPLAIYLFIDFFYRLKIISTYEYLERRFNAPTWVLTSAFFILLRITWMSTIVAATAMVMNKLTGLKVEHCIILFAATTTLYTLLGGMKAIIWTDILQFCLFMATSVPASQWLHRSSITPQCSPARALWPMSGCQINLEEGF